MKTSDYRPDESDETPSLFGDEPPPGKKEKAKPELAEGEMRSWDDRAAELAKEIEEQEKEEKEEEEEEQFESSIFAIKTAIGHEKIVAGSVALRARRRGIQLFSILSPTKLRGYILCEGVKVPEQIRHMLKGIPHARGLIDGDTSLGEIQHFLIPKPLVSGIEEGNIVEIISGPFKGEKARVQQIDESKEEITVELFEAMVSIPVTIRGDHVRVLEKERR